MTMPARKPTSNKPRGASALSAKSKPAVKGLDSDAEHIIEKDYRERLYQEQDKVEAELIKELRAEQDRREQEWRKAERTRLDQREKRLLEMLAERQAKVEDEWLVRRKTDSAAEAFAWFSEQQRELRQQLHASMQNLRQEFDSREQQHAEEVRREIAELEKQWSEKRRKELQRLEVDWREQEVMHRERVSLQRLEKEWKAEQQRSLEQFIGELRTELGKRQSQDTASYLSKLLPGLFQQWTEQYSAEHDARTRAAFKQIKAEWDALTKEKVEKELRETLAHAQKSIDSKLSEGVTTVTSMCKDRIKATQQDYAALAQLWEKKQIESIEGFKNSWTTFLATQGAQLKQWLDTELGRSLPAMFKQWSDSYKRDQDSKLQELYKQVWAAWDAELNEASKKATLRLASELKEALTTAIGHNEKTLHKLFGQLEQKQQTSWQEIMAKWEQERKAISQLKAGLEQETRQAVEHEARQIKETCDKLIRSTQAQIEDLSTTIQPKLEKRLSVLVSDMTKEIQAQHADLLQKWSKAYQEGLEKEQTAWQNTRDTMLKDISSDTLRSLQEQLKEFEKTHAQALVTETRQLRASLGEQIAIEIAQGLETLHEKVTTSFTDYAQKWQVIFEQQFAKLSCEFTKQHQQEIELLGQELRKDLAKQNELSTLALQSSFSSMLQQVSNEFKADFANELKMLENSLLEQHQAQLDALHQEWLSLQEATLAKAVEQLVTTNSTKLNELKSSLAAEYREDLHKATKADSEARAKAAKELSETAIASLEEQLSAAVKELNQEHTEHLEHLGLELKEKYAQELTRAFESWQQRAHEQVEAQTTVLTESFDERAREVAKIIEEQCYLEYRQRLGKMAEELMEKPTSEQKAPPPSKARKP